MTEWPISEGLRAYLDVQYELVRVLGTGGMGVVLLARERALERNVAIKVLHPDGGADAEAKERFRREARTAARLTHPNIVPLFTFGDVAGELYLVMGYVDGETLATRLSREERLSTEDASRILAELGDALEYAHRAGTIHRDLKPENILLEASTGRALLTDFGIARDLSSAGSLTSTGVIVGTPHYMSPEQAAGERDLDGRSDIYSLGVIGYRMLAGTLPFGGANAREVIIRHMTATAAPLPESVVEVAPGLASTVMRALSKAPEFRPANGGEIAAALRRDHGEEIATADTEQWDGVVPRIALFSLGAGAIFPLGSVLGFVPGSLGQTLLAWLAIVGISVAVTVGAVAVKFSTARGDQALREVRWRLALRPPRWWTLWWPRRFRRPGDIWDRLPREIRMIRWMDGVSFGLLIPAQVGFVAWLLGAEGSERLAQWLVTDGHMVKVVIGGSLALAVSAIGAMAFLNYRMRKRLGIALSAARVPMTLGVADPRWRQPRYAALLSPAEPIRAKVITIAELIRGLRQAGVQLPAGMEEVHAASQRAQVALDRELSGLREAVNAEEIQRLDSRIAALGDPDRALSEILVSQRELLKRAESRIAELGALRARLMAQERLLHQQLIALGELAPTDPERSEITGRLRAVNDDLRRLAESLSTL